MIWLQKNILRNLKKKELIWVKNDYIPKVEINNYKYKIIIIKYNEITKI